MNDALRAKIAADLAPVRPLPPPSRRVLVVVPLALLALVAAPLAFSFRDFAPLGWMWSWGASLLQTAVGLAIVTLALRQSVPGREWPAPILALAAIAAALLFAGITAATWRASPVDVAGNWWFVAAVCAIVSATTALPVAALAAVLVARAFPLQPRAAGALAGLGAGLAADAGWRLFCDYSAPAHVGFAHFGGVLLASAAGALLVRALWRARQSSPG